MPINAIRKRNFVYVAVSAIGLLLIVNAYLLYKNSEVIGRNKQLQEQAERLKVNTLDIVRNLHQVDMGVRGYYILRTSGQRNAGVEAIVRIDSVFSTLEKTLAQQAFPMDRFKNVKDSVLIYFAEAKLLLKMVDDGRDNEFVALAKKNNGYFAWKTYRDFSNEINAFEDGIVMRAKANYNIALRNSYLLQVILLIIAIPTLAYTAYYTVNAFKVSERLRLSEKEKAEILEHQNERLEAMVQERTNEILAQNEEIVSHNEQLRLQRNKIEAQHHTLAEAKQTIEEQNEIIRRKNEELLQEVERQTQDIIRTNAELIEHNSRLEQFTYIISHNLRAPMARLVGLSSVLDFATNDEERSKIVHLMVKSTSELDSVIRDLSQILAIQKLSTQVYSEIDLDEICMKISNMLDEEIKETEAMIEKKLDVRSIYSLPQYIESILYNLISNAIKYRHPERKPEISICVRREEGGIRMEVSDNGLGFDLERHRHNLFNLYKRFHFHVEGKGLGLYLVRTQIEAIGGRIEVASKLEEGTTFAVFLND